MQPHSLTNFEIQKYYQNEPEFNGVCSRNNLSNIKNGEYVINLDEFKSIGTHWITLHVNNNNGSASYDAIYFDSFEVEHIPKETKKFIGKKNIITNIYRIQAYESKMCGCFCIGFFDFILKGKSLLDYTNLFFPNEWKNNDKIILKRFYQLKV